MTVAQFKQQFETLASLNTEVNSFVFGDPFEQIQKLMQGLSAPIVIVESPDFRLDNHDYTGRVQTYSSELIVLDIAQLDDVADKYAKIDKTQEIAIEFVRKLEDFFQNDEFYLFELKSSIEQVRLNNHVGWKFAFTLAIDINISPNPSKWL